VTSVENDTVTIRQRRTGRWFLIFAIPAALLALAPLAWAFTSSLRPSVDIFSNLYPVTWETFVPTDASFENYRKVLEGSFSLALMNSVIVTVVGVALGLIVCVLAGFALAVLEFRGRTVIFIVLVFSFLVPFEAIAIPMAAGFRDLGLANTYIGLILPVLGNGMTVFMLRQFFLGIPISLAEAAHMDGMGWFGILWRIYLPLSRPVLVGGGLMLFVFQWQAYLWPLLVAPDPDLQVAPVAIAGFASQAGVDYGQMFAAVILTSVVPFVLLLVFQRQFTNSLASTGSKD
jgi:putative chitobiose transport system permease protein